MTLPPIDPDAIRTDNEDYDQILRFFWDCRNVTPTVNGRDVFLTFEPNAERRYLTGSVYDTLIAMLHQLKLLEMQQTKTEDGSYAEMLSLTGKGLEIAAMRYNQPIKSIVYTGRRV